MTKTEWLNYTKEHRQELVSLITDWHPMNRTITGIPPNTNDIAMMPEMANQMMRRKIRLKWSGGSPLLKFNQSLESGNIAELQVLFWEVWFGLPESVSFLQKLQGFDELTTLMGEEIDE